MGKILAVEPVHRLDDALQQLALGSIVGGFGDGDDLDALPAERGLVEDGVLPLACEAGALPDQYLPERGVGAGRRVDHPLEQGPVVDAAALGLVHVLAADDVAVLTGVVPERAELGGHGQVDVLAVAGHPGSR